jgi:hypothetical protein
LIKNKELKKYFNSRKSARKWRAYYVGTNDYLANGGDNMTFLAKVSILMI